MKLEFSNIGKFSKAEIEVNSITIVAGENDTGKSTIGKVLFAIFQSFYKIENKLREDKVVSVRKILNSGDLYTYYLENSSNNSFSSLVEDLSRKIVNQYTHMGREGIETIPELKEIFGENYEEILAEIILKLSVNREDHTNMIVTRAFKAEFNNRINNIYTNEKAQVFLKIKDKTLNLEINDNQVRIDFNNTLDLNTQVVYLEDAPQLAVSDMEYFSFISTRNVTKHHLDYLRDQLYSKKELDNIDEVIAKNNVDLVREYLDKVVDWSLISDNDSIEERDDTLPIDSMSSGIKSFYILKKAIEEGIFSRNRTIIIDEPEVHLHPEWQVLYAQILVVLQKELNLHILINTHSPYFLTAIRVYSENYGVENAKYYLSEKKQEFAKIEDVTNNVDRIYAKLSKPFEYLEQLKYEE